MSNPKDFKSSWEYINFYDSEETLNASYYADLVDHLVEQMTTPKPIEPKPKSTKRKPFEPIELRTRQIDPLDFPTYNTDGTWETGSIQTISQSLLLHTKIIPQEKNPHTKPL